MKKVYEKPDVEILSLIVEEEIATMQLSDFVSAQLGLEESDF